MKKFSLRKGLVLVGFATLAIAVAVGASTTAYFILRSSGAAASNPPAAAMPATPVSVATVEQRDIALWDEFSGRLEAVERVEVRSRVAGAVQAVHFREGALVRQGDLLITIDPAPYAAEVERAQAQVAAAQARVLLTKGELERGEQLSGSRIISQRDLDQRLNASREAEANLAAARAALQANKLNLDYTEIRAPVLTTLVSVDPIYASFNADEQVVAHALRSLAELGVTDVGRIPVRMTTVTGADAEGRMQLIDNQVDARSGTVRVRAVFANADGSLIPGQFARLQMGQPKSAPALAVNERAVGTDQSKRFVMVVDSDSKAEYREVTLGPVVHDGLRVVTSGLKPGEQIIVNGLQRVRPGARVAPQTVRMDARPELQARGENAVAAR